MGKNNYENVIKWRDIKVEETYKFYNSGNIEMNEPAFSFIGKVKMIYERYFVIERQPEVSFGNSITTTVLKANIISSRVTVYDKW
jgi:hypothetical protein